MNRNPRSISQKAVQVVLLCSVWSVLPAFAWTPQDGSPRAGKGLLPGQPPALLQEQHKKIVGLDYYYNREYKTTKNGIRHQFHYVWEDTADSGFSDLAAIIHGLGAETAALPGPPTSIELRPLSVYIIVDPDTPRETERPNVIDSSSIVTVEQWVRDGGILLLMGNDKGNAEFEHFNRLAERFGIHFNEDSHLRVVGKEYDMGAITIFPQHPVFERLKKIYMKEVTSLSATPPAGPLLTYGEICLIASARIGKGLVVAVGDPWLYNEYIGHRRLPVDFENTQAAVNLFRWVLSEP